MSELEEQILAEVRKFADQELKPIANERFHSTLNAKTLQKVLAEEGILKEVKELRKYENKFAEVPADVVDKMKELGLFGLIIPEEYGGLGLSYTVMAKVTEILSGAWLAAGSIATRNQITATALLKYGTEEQKKFFLPKLASGEIMTAIAVTEPDHGSDVVNLKTKAERDGNTFSINGTKMWCTYASRANYLAVLARTGGEGAKGLSLFLAPKPSSDLLESEGISGNYIHTIAYHGIPSFELTLENCKIALDHVIGEEAGIGKGLYSILKGFEEGRLQTAARSVGVAQAAFDIAFQYAKERKQFGKPIMEFQAMQHLLAEMFADLEKSRSLTYLACSLMDTKNPLAEFLCYSAKLEATQMVDRVTRKAMEIHGGYGIAQEYDVARLRMDAQVLDLFEGTPQIQRNMIAKRLRELGHPPERNLEEVADERLQVASGLLDVSRNVFLQTFRYAQDLEINGAKWIDSQAIQHLLANAFVDIEASAALLQRASQYQKENYLLAEALAHATIYEATRTIFRINEDLNWIHCGNIQTPIECKSNYHPLEEKDLLFKELRKHS